MTGLDIEIPIEKKTGFSIEPIEIFENPVSGSSQINSSNILGQVRKNTYLKWRVRPISFTLESDHLLTKMSIVKESSLPDYYSKNYIALKKSFLSELNRFAGDFDKEFLSGEFNVLAQTFSELPFIKCSVEITQSKSLKFTFA